MLSYLGVWSLGLFSPTFFSTSSKKKKLIKKEYCRCGPHPLQVISSRVRPPLVKGAGPIGHVFPDFRGWPLWFLASIAPLTSGGLALEEITCRGWGPHLQYSFFCGASTNLAPEVFPGASLHSEALSPECGRECPETGDCGPTRNVGAGRWGLLLADCSRVARAMTPGPPPQPHGWVRLGFEVSRFPDFWRGGRHVPTSPGCGVWGSLAPFFSPHP